MKKRIIALLRVSTDAQDVARQRADLERLKAKFGLSVNRVLELVGVSRTATLDNAQIQQLLADLERPGDRRHRRLGSRSPVPPREAVWPIRRLGQIRR